MNNTSFKLSIQQSMQLKGIALMLLLCHHLFYKQYGLYSDFTVAGHGIVEEFGKVSKVCVAIFVLLSGYGLGVQCRDKELNLWQFYKRRFTKLMTNYWLMWLLFVPVEIVLLYKSLNVKNNKITTILEFLGKHSMNIFLFHTFIFLYYMRDIVYATKDPLIIFVTLLAICLVISIVIEKTKSVMKIKKRQQNERSNDLGRIRRKASPFDRGQDRTCSPLA